jgi:hypothetical protein
MKTKFINDCFLNKYFLKGIKMGFSKAPDKNQTLSKKNHSVNS